MTTQINSAATAQPLAKSLLNAFLAGAGHVVDVLADASHGARCAREAERLFALSDAELAKRGLRRDQVITHAFRSYMAI